VQLKGQHHAVVVFIVRFQRPLQIAGKTVRGRPCSAAGPNHGQQIGTPPRIAAPFLGVVAQPQTSSSPSGFQESR
jgi:hypothetical protein